MAKDLRAALLAEGTDSSARAQALTRLVVLPFRSLRPDPETDFLSFGLADAITTSLSGLPALVVRSSAAAARLAGASLDLKVVAAEADVDRVLTGTLLRSGDQLRVSTQLVEAPAGTLIWSHTTQRALGDVFALQDDLTRGIVEALALPLSGPGAAPKADVPRSARAYEFYLRANEVARRYDQLTVARDLYLRCLDEDPDFAPAWAQLGRCHRVIGKYYEDSVGNQARAEAAFARAFELNPDLPTAHKLFTHLEAETGHAPRAVQRLLALARTRRNDAELFAGLVPALRYCGLIEASLAAHEEARRLDPHVPTSLEYTLLANGDFERLAQEGRTLVDQDAQLLGYSLRGLHAEAREVFDRLQVDTLPSIMRLSMRAFASLVTPEPSERMQAALEEAVASHMDPEALFLFGWIFAARGDGERALEVLERSIQGGYLGARTLERDERFDALRGEARFRELVKTANAGRGKALAAFREAGGETLLGLEPA
jgi:TolB-like protein